MLERAGSIAAPLLAGVSFALIVLVLSLQPTATRWPDTALSLLVAAGLLLVGTVQAIYWDEGQEGKWASVARALYDIGTLALVAGVVILLVPPPTKAGIPSARWVAIIIASVGFGAELLWAAVGALLGIRGRIRISKALDREAARKKARTEA